MVTRRGDPTDTALLAFARRFDVTADSASARYPQVGTIPFESERGYAATYHRVPDEETDGDGETLVFVKGAPERIIDMCEWNDDGATTGTVGTKSAARRHALDEATELAADGYRVLAVADGRLEKGSERVLLEIPEPQPNHNAGAIGFGPDGYLYVGVGDGGGGNDRGRGHVDDWYDAVEGGNGQDVTENLLGSILRIDVDGGESSDARRTSSGSRSDGGEGAPDRPEQRARKRRQRARRHVRRDEQEAQAESDDDEEDIVRIMCKFAVVDTPLRREMARIGDDLKFLHRDGSTWYVASSGDCHNAFLAQSGVPDRAS